MRNNKGLTHAKLAEQDRRLTAAVAIMAITPKWRHLTS